MNNLLDSSKELYKKKGIIRISMLTLPLDQPKPTKKELPSSKKEIEWLDYCRKHFNKEILTKQKITIFIDGKKKKYYPDGYTKFPDIVCWEFMGCFWHGHDCLDHERNLDAYNRTIEKLDNLKKNNYKCFIIWECEYKLFKEGKTNTLGYYY